MRSKLKDDPKFSSQTAQFEAGGLTPEKYLRYLDGLSSTGGGYLQSVGTSTDIVDFAKAVVGREKRKQLEAAFEVRSSRANSAKGYGMESIGDKWTLKAAGGKMSSGKSQVRDCYRSDNPKRLFKVKITRNSESYEKERLNANKLKWSSGVVSLVDSYEDFDGRGSNALVFERGETDLKSLIAARDSPLPPLQALSYLWDTADALAAIHARGLVWGDLSCQNLVTVGGKAKAIDLEFAVSKGARLASFTPQYCPPEVAAKVEAGKQFELRADQAIDLWSLGMVGYELCAGVSYFDDSPSYNGITISELASDFTPDLSAITNPFLKLCISLLLSTTPAARRAGLLLLQLPRLAVPAAVAAAVWTQADLSELETASNDIVSQIIGQLST